MAEPNLDQIKAFFRILNEDLNFDDAARISSAKIQRLLENTSAAPFLTDFIRTVKKENVLSSEELESFRELSDQGRVKSGVDLERFIKRLEACNAGRETRKLELDGKIKKANMKKKRLEYELAQINKLKQQQTERAERVLELTPETSRKLRDQKNETTHLSDELTKTVFALSAIFQKLCSVIDNSNDGCLLLSQVPLQDFIQAEESYNAQLTSFVKRQFFQISQSIKNDLDAPNGAHNVHSLADEGLFSEETEETRKMIASDIKRAQLGYSNREKALISAQARESACFSAVSYLQGKRAEAVQNPSGTTEKLRKSLEETRESVRLARSQNSKLSEETIPRLISQGTPLEATHLLEGDYHWKLIRQEYFVEKQNKVISLLQNQKRRLDLLWMMLAVEEADHRNTGKQIPLLIRELYAVLNESIVETEWFNTNKEATTKCDAIINQGDNVAVEMCRVLGRKSDDRGDESDDLFHDVQDLPCASRKLWADLNLVRNDVSSNPSKDETRLDNLYSSIHGLESLLAVSDPDVCEGGKKVNLTPESVCAMTAHLQKEFRRLSDMTSNSAKEIEKKRSFLEYHKRASVSRTAWLDFYLEPNKLHQWSKE